MIRQERACLRNDTRATWNSRNVKSKFSDKDYGKVQNPSYLSKGWDSEANHSYLLWIYYSGSVWLTKIKLILKWLNIAHTHLSPSLTSLSSMSSLLIFWNSYKSYLSYQSSWNLSTELIWKFCQNKILLICQHLCIFPCSNKILMHRI